jgi:adenine deaminase
MIVQPKDRKRLVAAAMGKIPFDTVIKNAQVFNVFSGEVLPAEIGIIDGFIAHVEWDHINQPWEALETIDAKSCYVLPGLIDAHVHIESSMLTPPQFAAAVLPWGTTTVVTDPHEIANVWGKEGVHYMHDSGENTLLRQFLHIPSCVPAVSDCEHAGASFFAKEIAELFALPRVIGLAEVMDYIGVIENDDRMHDILEEALKRNRFIQGHVPFLSGNKLSAYRAAGPQSCHESRTAKEGVDKIRVGMFVDARDSSIAKNVAEVLKDVQKFRYLDSLCLCTDDREPEDILVIGHMNDVVNSAIQSGLHPLDAIRSATYNTARQIGEQHLGAIAPGYAADLIFCDRIEEIIPTQVYINGQCVAKEGQLTKPIESSSYDIETRNSMNVQSLSLDDFIVCPPINHGTLEVNVMSYDNLTSSTTRISTETFSVRDKQLVLPNDRYNYVAVINRYGTQDIAVHVVKDFGTHQGALASTVSHDSHNLTIVYKNPEDAWVAANTLISCGGGMCSVLDQSVTCLLPLEVGGLMSAVDAHTLANKAAKMKEAVIHLGLTALKNPLLRIVSLALPVIPYAKMSDLGCIDVLTKKFIPLFPR